MGDLFLGCSGWDYPDTVKNGGWLGVFYPTRQTRRLSYYSDFFGTVEMDSTFYDKLYSKMSRGTFMGLVRATPEDFQFSIKVPQTITHKKKLNVERGAADDLDEFLDTISALKRSNKLGTILIQLPSSFTVDQFKNVEGFLERLPRGFDFAVEFRHKSWQTEGPWELLKHYNIASVITDCPDEELQFLSNQLLLPITRSYDGMVEMMDSGTTIFTANKDCNLGLRRLTR